MIPETPEILSWAAMRLMTDVAPRIEPGYGQASAGTLGMMMILAAQEYEKAADTRVWENTRLSNILAKGGIDPGPPVESLLISALTATNNRLKADLIRLHESVEGGADPGLEREILEFLKESANRRKLSLG